MQGNKNYTEALFTNFQLSDHVPEDNFYRRLRGALDLRYMRKLTAPYYGTCGQTCAERSRSESIDPEVFMKIMLVGYLVNIISDRKVLPPTSVARGRHYAALCVWIFSSFWGTTSMSRCPASPVFRGHSTLSRTRALLPDSVFTEAFEQVLRMCMDKGMVGGHTQSVDSAPVKANASMDSIELKVPADELDEHLRKIRAMSAADRPDKEDKDDKNPPAPRRKAQNNKATEEQQTITADERTLKEIKSRNTSTSLSTGLKRSTTQTERPGAKHKNSKYTSNKTHYSPVDPDARISVKPGKARKLYPVGFCQKLRNLFFRYILPFPDLRYFSLRVASC